MNTVERRSFAAVWLPAGIFLLLAVVLVSLATAFFAEEAERLRQTRLAELAAIGELKVGQVLAWRADRMRDGAGVSADPLLRDEVGRLVDASATSVPSGAPGGSAASAARTRVEAWLEALVRAEGFLSASFLGRDGRVLLSAGEASNAVDPLDLRLIEGVFTTGVPRLSDLHRGTSGAIHLDVLAPIARSQQRGGGVVAVLVASVDPRDFLFPLIQRWPTPSLSSETLLVRREGAEVVFLNELRHRAGTALTLRFPASSLELLAAQAVRGTTGIVEGIDYRGERVIGVARAIPDSGWFLVAKVDSRELLAPVRARGAQVTTFTVAAVLFSAVMVLLLFRHRQARLYRQLYRTEAEHRSLAERYGLLSRRANDVIFLLGPEGRVLEANGRAVDIYGFSREQLLGLELAQLQAPGSAELAQDLLGRARATGSAVSELLHQKSDGVTFPVEVSVSLVRELEGERFVAVLRDVSRRRAAEEALAAEKERLAVTLRSIGDGVIATDTAGAVTLMNPVAEQLTGWTLAEAQGRALKEVFQIVHAQTREPCESPVDRVLSSGQVQGLANHTALVARGGRECLIADSGAPIRDHHGKVLGVVMVFRDVTTVEQIEEKLQRAQKLESVAVLAGGIAHDFNNLLTSITGNVSLARIKANVPSERDECLAEAEAASARARELTQQLLTFSKGGAPVKKLSDLAKLAKEAARFATRGSSVVCRVEAEAGLWLAEVDPGQLTQVLNNLLLNALQAMPAGGVVEVRLTNVALEANNAYALPRGSFVRIGVVDQGVGISEQLLPRIFDPYFTTKQHGSGLGLSICHSIVRRHDGQINVRSTLGRGSTFEVLLPASPGATLDVPAGEARALPAGSGRILIMDDEQPIRRLARRLLGTLGYDVVEAADGAEALRLYREAQEAERPFSVVIADLTIPGGMGGKELAEQLLRLDPAASIIVSSGYANDPILASFREHGFKGILPKPYRVDDLHAALRPLLEAPPGRGAGRT